MTKPNNRRARGGDGQLSREPVEVQILERMPSSLTRPLSIVDGHGFALSALPVKPKKGSAGYLVVALRNDGQLFSAQAVKHPKITGTLESIDIHYENIPLPLTETMSIQAILDYADGVRPKPTVVFSGVFGVLDHFVEFNRSLSDQRTMCELAACWVIATYFTSVFDVVGYLWITGAHGSGKTQLLSTASNLSYLGRIFLSSSSFAATRDAANWGATLGFDDSEVIEDQSKRELLLAGSRRGARITTKIKREDGNWENGEFDIYCPRLFSATQQPDAILGSRCITIPMVRGADASKTRREPINFDSWPTSRRALIDQLWSLGLEHLTTVRQYYEAAAENAALRGRDLDPWRGVLAIALWLQTEHGVAELFDRLNSLSTDFQTERASLEKGNDVTRLAIRALVELYNQGKTSILTFTPTILAARVNSLAQELGICESGENCTNDRKIGWLLKQLRLERAPRDKSHRPWQAGRDQLLNLATAYGVPGPQERNAENAGNGQSGPHKGGATRSV